MTDEEIVDVVLAAAGASPAKAFESDVIKQAASLSRTSPAYQDLVPRLRSMKVRVSDWERAVREARGDSARPGRRSDVGFGDRPTVKDTSTIRNWIRQKLLLTTDGRLRANLANLMTILVHDPTFENRLAYHELREAEVTVEPIPWHHDDAPAKTEPGDWTQQDSTRLASWLARTWDLDVPSKLAEEAVEAVARRRVFNPLIEYLESLVWDGYQRLETWLPAYFGTPDTRYTREVGGMWAVGAVARAFTPGCQADYVMTLQGLQGIGKSSALRAMCRDDGWFFDDELKIGDKEAAQVLRGKWIVELSELSSIRRSELEAVKAFVSRRVDSYRPTHARRARDFPRRCIFAGSTNALEFLDDEENRRFLPVMCSRIDVDAIHRDREQLLAEAVFRFRADAVWHVADAELRELCAVEQEARRRTDPWETYIGGWLSARLDKTADDHRLLVASERCDCPRCVGATIPDVLESALKMPRSQADKVSQGRAALALRRLGWAPGEGRSRSDQGRVRRYYPPPE